MAGDCPVNPPTIGARNGDQPIRSWPCALLLLRNLSQLQKLPASINFYGPDYLQGEL